MGFQDRPYLREQQPPSGGGYGGGYRVGLGGRGLTPMVKYLLLINCVVFVLQLIFKNPEKYEGFFNGDMEYWFSATTLLKYGPLQIWRYITFQFLHSTSDPFHILFNMIGLYFLGRIMEQAWGGKKFVFFYLACGFVGGLLFVLASKLGIMSKGSLVGASGGVLGLVAACAVLFPQIMLIFFVFPVPIRTAAILLTVVYLLFVLTSGPNAGGHLCHLGGMATGFLWVKWAGYTARLGTKLKKGAWQRKQQQQMQLEYEVDRILKKLHEQGINSLTRKEKQILQKATEEQKNKERKIYRPTDY